MSKTEKYRVIVLNDGETYTDLDGCCVLTIEVPTDKPHETAKAFRQDLDAAVKEARHLYKAGASAVLDSGIRVTLDDWLDERLGNDG